MIRPLLLALFPCGACSAPAAALNRANPSEPESRDPHKAGIEPEENIIADILIGLTAPDASGKPIPGAAESWDVSADGKLWTFHLRKESWSDGVPV